MTTERLDAAEHLTLHFDDAPHWRIAWGESDWWGPVRLRARVGDAPVAGPGLGLDVISRERFAGEDDLGSYRGVELRWAGLATPVRVSVRAYREQPVLVFRLEAPAAIHALATGVFAEPSVAWPFLAPSQRGAGGVPVGTRSYGHQYTEFALPVSGDADCVRYRFAPHRPAVVEPLLLVAPDRRTLMLAPLDQFHEQIIAVPADAASAAEGVRCGWHGDLGGVPSGFSTELAIWAGTSPRQVLTEWAAFLQARHRTVRPSRYADTGVGKLSYWTDNGAVYYYRTEPERDYTDTLAAVIGDLHQRSVPVASLQIDSWFYPHQIPRPISAEGAPIVPPSGMVAWEPRADVLPDGFAPLRHRVGNLPFIFHSRHFSSAATYFERFAGWCDGDYAHPADEALYAVLMEQASSWGAITYEQDWLVESFLGVRGLREGPGRARRWQEALDRAAGARGLSLQWCMASPADFFQSVTLRHLSSIRTSGDYRYLFDNGLNWLWLLHTNALARALGLHAFKDVFLSHGPTSLSAGEPYADVEALLASLSAGPVGIGDQLGCTNRELVMRSCREDGVLIKPDAPIAALDRCFHGNAFFESELLVGETFSAHPAGRWVYVVSLNACQRKQPISGRVALADLGSMRPRGPVVVYDWRRGTWERLEADGGWDVTLSFQDWDFRVLCPLLPGEVTIFGDVRKYATMGDRRIANVQGDARRCDFDVIGVPSSMVELRGAAARAPASVSAGAPPHARVLRRADVLDGNGERWWWHAGAAWSHAGTGEWGLCVAIDAGGWTRVSIELSGCDAMG